MSWRVGLLIAIAGGVLGADEALAQTVAPVPASDEQGVRCADDAFWRAFNACDAAAMADYFTEDVEFYQDLTGLTRTRSAVVASLIKGPCGTPGLHLRGES
ncbi:nuclear transport factor 2 family protein [Sphingomonas kyeonggiensis]|uniref:DUF4440 domain-containing protein n=1 Tax=Sphingomonas kyeonggiensis TaxID=1268553 RepID=A0A7W6JWC9_9SPHN|nr:hypothetical protein [Sphingomonas kyeonggiensis]